VCFNAEMFAADLSKAADDSDETKINVPLEYPRVPLQYPRSTVEYPWSTLDYSGSAVRAPS
jgi:hypothetical protein